MPKISVPEKYVGLLRKGRIECKWVLLKLGLICERHSIITEIPIDHRVKVKRQAVDDVAERKTLQDIMEYHVITDTCDINNVNWVIIDNLKKILFFSARNSTGKEVGQCVILFQRVRGSGLWLERHVTGYYHGVGCCSINSHLSSPTHFQQPHSQCPYKHTCVRLMLLAIDTWLH